MKLNRLKTILTAFFLTSYFVFPNSFKHEQKRDSFCADSIIVSDTCNNQTINKKTNSPFNIFPFNIDSLQLENNLHSVNKGEYEWDNFRFFGDIFQFHFPAFVNDFGSFGQPHEINLYGLGSHQISALYNGVSFEDNIYGFINFHRFQTNGISAVHLFSLPRGFLSGNFINPISVAFEPVKKFEKVPHTRIFYFQGANKEALINIFFHSRIYKKLFITFDLSNAMIEPEYKNSDYETWNGSVKFSYLVDSSFVYTFLFSRYRAKTQLFGGVDIDSLTNSNGQVDYETFYNGYLAPVNYPNRNMTTDWNNYFFGIDKTFGKSHKLTFAATASHYSTTFNDENYYRPYELADSVYTIKTEYDYLGQKLSAKVIYNLFYSEFIFNNSVTGILGYDSFDKKLITSVFGRLVYDDNDKRYGGLGFDVKSNLTENFSVYIGASKYSRYRYFDPYLFNNTDIDAKGNITTAELNLAFNTKNITLTASGYYFKNANEIVPYQDYIDPMQWGDVSYFNATHEIKGAWLNGKINWKFFTFNFNYSYLINKINDLQVSPKHNLRAGIFYKGILFSGNLYMKAGFNFYFIGKQNYFYRDFIHNQNIWFYNNSTRGVIPIDYYNGSEDSFTFDFFFAGRIQNRATVYFVFENLADKKYFIVPYYPKQSRGIRFGISWDLYN